MLLADLAPERKSQNQPHDAHNATRVLCLVLSDPRRMDLGNSESVVDGLPAADETAETESHQRPRFRRTGGLGLRSAVRCAPAAYWASWADTNTQHTLTHIETHNTHTQKHTHTLNTHTHRRPSPCHPQHQLEAHFCAYQCSATQGFRSGTRSSSSMHEVSGSTYPDPWTWTHFELGHCVTTMGLQHRNWCYVVLCCVVLCCGVVWCGVSWCVVVCRAWCVVVSVAILAQDSACAQF